MLTAKNVNFRTKLPTNKSWYGRVATCPKQNTHKSLITFVLLGPTKNKLFSIFLHFVFEFSFCLVWALFRSQDKNYQHLNCKCKYDLTTFYYALCGRMRPAVEWWQKAGKNILLKATFERISGGSANAELTDFQELKSFSFSCTVSLISMCVTEGIVGILYNNGKCEWKGREKFFLTKKNFEHV